MPKFRLFTSFMLIILSCFCYADESDFFTPEDSSYCCQDLNCNCGCAEGSPCNCSNLNGDIYERGQWAIAFDGDCDETIRPTHIDPPLWTIEGGSCSGVWMPEDPVLFRPFMADPREIDYSVGWRFNDNAMTNNIIDVSFGDIFPIYRWSNIGPWDGDLEIDLEGGVWATFDPLTESAPLMNADYYVGVPVTYAIPNWQFRLRGFHISSHIGDEFLLNNPGFDRRNASAEYLDFFISYDFTQEIRLFAGLGYIVQQDDEFRTSRFFSALGFELRLLSLGFLDPKDILYGTPIFATYFRQNGEFRNHIDSTYILGYEFGKLCGLYRKMRIFIEYHDGYSVEGQYFKCPTKYLSIRMSYGY